MTNPMIYEGLISEAHHYENWEALFLGDGDDDDEPLAETLMHDRDRRGPYASVRYFISDTPKTIDELEEGLVRRLAGQLDADYDDHYSEITGYLWTDEEIRVGGHDLMAELRSHVGRYAYIEITWSEESP
jgi:hypothetical protein